MQVAAVHAKGTRRGGPVAVVCAHGGENHLPLVVFELIAEGPLRGRTRWRRVRHAGGVEGPTTSRCAGVTVTTRPESRRAARGAQHGAADDVLELAHVARPVGRRELRGARRRRAARRHARAVAPPLSAKCDGEQRDVLSAIAQRRHVHRERPRAGRRGRRESGRAPPRAPRSRLVAAITRTSTRCTRSLPTRWISPCCSARSSLGWISSGSSPISSRNSVPPSATSNLPARSRCGAGERARHVPEQLALGDADAAAPRS